MLLYGLGGSKRRIYAPILCKLSRSDNISLYRKAFDLSVLFCLSGWLFALRALRFDSLQQVRVLFLESIKLPAQGGSIFPRLAFILARLVALDLGRSHALGHPVSLGRCLLAMLLVCLGRRFGLGLHCRQLGAQRLDSARCPLGRRLGFALRSRQFGP